MLFDSHLHFDITHGDHGIGATVARARTAGVLRMLAVGGSPALNRRAITAARRFPDVVQAAIGWDRDQATRWRQSHTCLDATAMREVWQQRLKRCRIVGAQIVALGEIGLDYHYDAATADAQCRLMRCQLETAAALRLPVIVHSRNAETDTLRLLSEYSLACRRSTATGHAVGVVHCFTGSHDFAGRLLELDFMLGFSGIVTFRKADSLRDVARHVPDHRLLVETDAPYLAPVPYRGRRNEPALLPAVLQCLADVRQTSPDDLARITTQNAIRLLQHRP